MSGEHVRHLDGPAVQPWERAVENPAYRARHSRRIPLDAARESLRVYREQAQAKVDAVRCLAAACEAEIDGARDLYQWLIQVGALARSAA